MLYLNTLFLLYYCKSSILSRVKLYNTDFPDEIVLRNKFDFFKHVADVHNIDNSYF